MEAAASLAANQYEITFLGYLCRRLENKAIPVTVLVVASNIRQPVNMIKLLITIIVQALHSRLKGHYA